MSSGLFVGVAFGQEREKFSVAGTGIAERLEDEQAGGLHGFEV